MCWVCGSKSVTLGCAACEYVSGCDRPVKYVIPTFVQSNFNLAFTLPETTRLAQLSILNRATFSRKHEAADEDKSDDDDGDTVGLSALAQWKQSRKRYRKDLSAVNKKRHIARSKDNVSRPVMRLLQFMKLLKLIDTYPEMTTFRQNDQITRKLVASHLPLIVGFDDWDSSKSELYPLIDGEFDLSNMQNLVWITNRYAAISRFLTMNFVFLLRIPCFCYKSRVLTMNSASNLGF